jgi:hypothetical protein
MVIVVSICFTDGWSGAAQPIKAAKLTMTVVKIAALAPGQLSPAAQ